ncbi:helix-turn-helix domain-containing protein [Aliinostoc sp. HNIBRCY26]|uniref:helix-turn-helix domain-containing protein n=1 Tax=Aliinostoc sp. HNIBRCY26 TaxID=3418997 RepID=UPI003D086B1D
MTQPTRYAVLWVRADKYILYANEAACKFLGYSHHQILSMTLEDLNLDSFIEIWSNYWTQLQQQGSLSFEGFYQTQKGHKSSLEITITYMSYQSAECCCISFCETSKPIDIADDYLQEYSEHWSFCSTKTAKQSTLVPFCAEKINPSDIKLRFSSHPQLKAVFDFIEANYHQPITLCDVAQSVGYSSAYLTDLVRRCTGKPVNHWIVERRMSAARSLLLETAHSISYIAEVVGYQYEGHFFRQFRQYHKTTPQAWRKEQRQKTDLPENIFFKLIEDINFYK